MRRKEAKRIKRSVPKRAMERAVERARMNALVGAAGRPVSRDEATAELFVRRGGGDGRLRP
ncbi:MAG: hypothetical protein ACX94C_11690 [Phycisphaerales bacterium]